MSRKSDRLWSLGWLFVWPWVGTLGLPSAWSAPTSATSGASVRDDSWKRCTELIRKGDFQAAADLLKQSPAVSESGERLRTWLSEYLTRQEARRRIDKEEFDLYTGYARARIERKEYPETLRWILYAADVADDREKFLQTDWVQEFVREALTYANGCQGSSDWQCAWEVYSWMAAIFEREERYQKLEREAVTHLRLEAMFREPNWIDRLANVRWDDGEEALEYIGAYYVEPADFKKLAEGGIEQVLLLAESRAAQQGLEGLKNDDDRRDFIDRVRGRLEQIRSAPSLDRPGCQQHFRRIREINRQTVKIPEELLINELMRGALDPLDEFTTILWPKDTEEFDKHTRGNFIGVGIQIIKNRANEIEVVTPLDDTPAYRAGIRAGDIISFVDGAALRDISLNKVVELITGEKGSTVVLTVRRDGNEINYPLERDEVKIQSIKGMKRDPERDGRWNHWLDRDNGIGYVRVTNFQRNSVEDVDAVLRELRAQGLKGLVLDLRGNPGGLLDSAWQMSSLFLKKNEAVVSTRGRIPEENHKYAAPNDGPYADIPLAVLVDESSASASEIVSGAVRDNGRGIVVGARTFGKFSVQNLVPLSHSRAKLKITTASYYLPSGVSLHRKTTSETWGVDPNVPIRLVRWERSNLWQLRREADLLGPAASKPGLTPADGESDAEEGPDTILEPLPPLAGGEAMFVEVQGPPALPTLKQPDKNRRPKEDPQLDAAILVIRSALLGGPTSPLAAAENLTPGDGAKP